MSTFFRGVAFLRFREWGVIRRGVVKWEPNLGAIVSILIHMDENGRNCPLVDCPKITLLHHFSFLKGA